MIVDSAGEAEERIYTLLGRNSNTRVRHLSTTVRWNTHQ